MFVHLMSGTLAINIMLLVPAFRAMDNALAESSHTLGASRFTTLRRMIAPSLLPTIGLVTLLGLVRGVDAFEAVLVVGAREQIDVLGRLRRRCQRPPALRQRSRTRDDHGGRADSFHRAATVNIQPTKLQRSKRSPTADTSVGSLEVDHVRSDSRTTVPDRPSARGAWREGQPVAMHIAPQRLQVWPNPTAMESAIEVIEQPLAKAA